VWLGGWGVGLGVGGGGGCGLGGVGGGGCVGGGSFFLSASFHVGICSTSLFKRLQRCRLGELRWVVFLLLVLYFLLGL